MNANGKTGGLRVLFALMLAALVLGCGDDGGGSSEGAEDGGASPDGGESPDGAAADAGDSGSGDATPDPDAEGDAQDIGDGADGGGVDVAPDVPPVCNGAAECDDGNPCTDDSCLPQQGCLNVPLDCDDGDACTADGCDPEGAGCTHAPIACDDGNACTTESCDALAGCLYALVDCSDGDACTTDACSPETGTCANKPANCDDGDSCTDDSCDAAQGCKNVPKEGPCCTSDAQCADTDVCTQDFCVQGTCVQVAIPLCCATVADCDTSNACVEVQCQAGKCFEKPVSNNPQCCTAAPQCDDSDPSTLDGCADNVCVSEPTACAAENDCFSSDCVESACAAGQCAYTAESECCNAAAWSEDFEGTKSSLILSNSVAVVGWHLAAIEGAPEGNVALRYGAPGGPGYTGAGAAHKGTASTDWFKLPLGAQLELEMKARIDVRVQTGVDRFQVRIQDLSGQLVLWDRSAVSAGPDWQTITIPLGAFQGRTVRLIFFFDSINVPPAVGGNGISIASLEVTSACAATSCAADADCNDGLPLTQDTCNPTLETCGWAVAPGWCDEVKGCDDGDPCTQNLCTANACNFVPIAGCCQQQADCEDADPCTTDTCVLGGGAVSGTCNYNDVPGCCTADSQCNDLDPCTEDSCDIAGLQCINALTPGCCSASSQCDDGDPCTADACVAFVCEYTNTCCQTNADCDDGDDICTVETCAKGQCVVEFTFEPGCCDPQVASFAFNDQLEPAWTFVNSAGVGKGWQLWLSSPFTKSAPGALYYGEPALQNYSFNSVASNGTATSPPVALYSGVAAELRLWVYMNTETGSSYDRLWVYVKTPTATFTVWEKANVLPATWVEITADLSAFAGQEIQIQLDFDTVDSIANDTLGVLVDDVQILSSCAPNACSTDADCDDAIVGTDSICDAGTCVYSAP